MATSAARAARPRGRARGLRGGACGLGCAPGVRRAKILAVAPEGAHVDRGSGWRADSLEAEPGAWVLELSAAHLRELDACVANAVALVGDDVGLEALGVEHLPLGSLGAALRRLKAERLVEGPGIALVRGLPVDRYSLAECAVAYWAIMLNLGGVDAVPQNAKGHLLGHVYDLGGDASDPRTRIYTTKAAQPFHTDSADIVGLLCLERAMRGGESQVVSSTAVFRAMQAHDPGLAAELAQPLVWSRKGEVPPGCEPWFEVPVFSEVDGRVASMHDISFIEAAQKEFAAPDGPVLPLTEAQQRALDMAERLAWELRFDMVLERGDIQILHNHQVWHARSAYDDWPRDEEGRFGDGGAGMGGGGKSRKRHLLRMWLSVRENSGRWRLPEGFAARYGDLDAPVRGGIRAKQVDGTAVKVKAPLTPC